MINVAVGVVTGLVQEFQFGMNWSAYSRFVGDVFGAPLAMEGLAAFFLESTFLGLWLFGWDRLSPRVHLATIWAVALGGALSAAFIMAANSWMQHPVGYTIEPGHGPAAAHRHLGRVDQPGVPAGLRARPARLAGHRRRRSCSPSRPGTCAAARTRRSSARSARLALVVLLPASILAMIVGSELGVIEATYQPMKIAAAEAQWETCQPCSFSLFQIGGGNDDQTPTKIIEIPHLLSLLATNSLERPGAGPQRAPGAVRAAVRAGRLRAERVRPVLVDAGDGLHRGAGLPARPSGGCGCCGATGWTRSRWFLRLAVWAVVLPFVMNTAGWLLTENGRQPWIVQGLQLTKDGVSPSVSTAEVAISIIVVLPALRRARPSSTWCLMLALRPPRARRPGAGGARPTSRPRVPAMTY